MMESTRMVKNMAMAHLFGRMDINIPVSGIWESKMDRESISLQMVVLERVYGKKERGFNGIDNLIYTIM